MRDETVHALLQRSDGCCEAYVELAAGVWTRCGRVPIHIHHMLRRSHGGELLDEVGEIYHLICLCNIHHGEVHQGAYPDSGLLIEGNVYPGPVYVGGDEYLSQHYPPKEGA